MDNVTAMRVPLLLAAAVLQPPHVLPVVVVTIWREENVINVWLDALCVYLLQSAYLAQRGTTYTSVLAILALINAHLAKMVTAVSHASKVTL